jgi:hypothetical protein
MSVDEVPSPAPKPLCFVIGPIGKAGSETRKHSDLLLHAVIKHVLEAVEFSFQVKRADEDTDPGMIGDRVILDLRDADLVVADLTDLNPNAFYELGIRHSTLKPTIHVAKAGTLLPFDNVSHRAIFVDLSDWRSIEEARQTLAKLTRRTKEPDFRVSNPITQANASFALMKSDDPRDVTIANLMTRVEALEHRSIREYSETRMRSEPTNILTPDRRLKLLRFAQGSIDRGRPMPDILASIASYLADRGMDVANLVQSESNIVVSFMNGSEDLVIPIVQQTKKPNSEK